MQYIYQYCKFAHISIEIVYIELDFDGNVKI